MVGTDVLVHFYMGIREIALDPVSHCDGQAEIVEGLKWRETEVHVCGGRAGSIGLPP